MSKSSFGFTDREENMTGVVDVEIAEEDFADPRAVASAKMWERENARDVFGWRCPNGHAVDDVRLPRAKCRDCGCWYELEECEDLAEG